MQLKFIHIPRTGGTTIEDLAQKSGIHWGRFDHWYSQNANYTYDSLYGINKNLPPWHLVLKQKKEIWSSYKFFAVIRNPLERFISAYYMPYPQRDGIADRHNENITLFNKNISGLLDKIKPKFIGQYGHQHHYINFIYKNNIYLIGFDNLVKDCNILFEKYNLSINMSNSFVSGKSRSKFTIKDLSKNNIDKIKQIFIKDYDLYINILMNTLDNKFLKL